MAVNTDVCRAAIRPVERPACEYNEWLSPVITHALARSFVGGYLEATAHPGIARDTTAPAMTLQDFMVPGKAVNNAATQQRL